MDEYGIVGRDDAEGDLIGGRRRATVVSEVRSDRRSNQCRKEDNAEYERIPALRPVRITDGIAEKHCLCTGPCMTILTYLRCI